MRLTSVSRREGLTPTLPVPYPALVTGGLRLRYGQLSLTVSAPGVGKSQLWLNIASRMALPAAYWSADTDAHDVTLRTLALWSGNTTSDVEKQMTDPAWAGWYAEKLEQGSHVDWIFDAAITLELLKQRMRAFAEVHGDWPKLMVIDNLSNVVQSEADERLEQQAFMKGAQIAARESGCHIAILAHSAAEYENGDKPIPMAGVLNKLNKIPSTVVTLHRASESQDLLGVNIVKNRGGQADPAARHPIHLSVDYSRALVGGFRVAA